MNEDKLHVFEIAQHERLQTVDGFLARRRIVVPFVVVLPRFSYHQVKNCEMFFSDISFAASPPPLSIRPALYFLAFVLLDLHLHPSQFFPEFAFAFWRFREVGHHFLRHSRPGQLFLSFRGGVIFVQFLSSLIFFTVFKSKFSGRRLSDIAFRGVNHIVNSEERNRESACQKLTSS